MAFEKISNQQMKCFNVRATTYSTIQSSLYTFISICLLIDNTTDHWKRVSSEITVLGAKVYYRVLFKNKTIKYLSKV